MIVTVMMIVMVTVTVTVMVIPFNVMAEAGVIVFDIRDGDDS